MCIGVAISRYHRDVTDRLEAGAVAAFTEAGGAASRLMIVESPGSFELIVICNALVQRGDLDAVVALGCIITGETTHDQHLATAVAGGLASVMVASSVPITFGVLTCQTMEQAMARAGGSSGNKGAEAMHAAIRAAHGVQSILGTRSIV